MNFHHETEFDTEETSSDSQQFSAPITAGNFSNPDQFLTDLLSDMQPPILPNCSYSPPVGVPSYDIDALTVGTPTWQNVNPVPIIAIQPHQDLGSNAFGTTVAAVSGTQQRTGSGADSFGEMSDGSGSSSSGLVGIIDTSNAACMDILRANGYPGPNARTNVKVIGKELVRTFIGVDAMKTCTIKGRLKRKPRFDQHLMAQIKLLLRQKVCMKETDEEFEEIWQDVQKSIAKTCTYTRRKVTGAGAEKY